MILTLNKRQLIEDGEVSSEPMTDTPPNSEGETVFERIKDSLDFANVLRKHAIDKSEANRRAILSVTRRRFKDEDVTEHAWRVHKPQIIEGI